MTEDVRDAYDAMAEQYAAFALDDLDQATIGVFLGVQALDLVEKLVVRKTQPALRERLVVGPLVPGSATPFVLACFRGLGCVVGIVHGGQV